MASDNSEAVMKEIDDELSCFICNDLLVEPKDLDCPHVFCLQCLQVWVSNKPNIECPQCHHVTNVPSGGLTKLKTNYSLENIVKRLSTGERRVPTCKVHEGDRLHFYCETCNTTVCQACLALDHRPPDHAISNLKNLSDTTRAAVREKLTEIQEAATKSDEEDQHFNNMKTQIESALDAGVLGIEQRVQDVIAFAKTSGESMKKRLSEIGQQRLHQVEEEKHRVKERGKQLREIHKESKHIVEKYTDHAFVTKQASINEKLGTLCSVSHSTLVEFNPGIFQFHPGPSALPNTWFGQLGITLRNLTLFAEFGNFKKAQDIAATQTGFIAVVDSGAKGVPVYHYDNEEYKRYACLAPSDHAKKTEQLPLCVVSTSQDTFLVTDSVRNVKEFSSEGQYEKTLSIKGRTITTVSTSKTEDFILVASRSQSNIEVYKSNGELLKSHKVEIPPVCVASNGTQIAFSNTSMGLVCFIDLESGLELLRLELRHPKALCYDDQSGSLLIGRNLSGNKSGIIEQYCITTGKLHGCLARGLYSPLGMAFVGENKLAVADVNSVKIYNIS